MPGGFVITQPCRQCGKTYQTSGRSDASPFCGRECQKRSVGHIGDRRPRPCEGCGVTFAPPRSFTKYCLSECGVAARHRREAPKRAERERRKSYRRLQKSYAELLAKIADLNRKCGWCLESISGTHPARKFCSEKCMRFGLGHRATSSPVYIRPCTICGSLFAGRNPNSLYCSKGCVREGRSQDRIGARRNDIFERDGWVCKLCDSPVDLTDFTTVLGADGREAFVAGPLYPSVDHIVPQSFRGSHEDHNLRTAHRECNRKRGIGGEYEQLAWAA